MGTGSGTFPKQRSKGGFTLFEVMICLVIIAVVFGGIIRGYITTSYRAQWTGYSLAAQAIALQTIEQARSATWDTAVNTDEVTNMIKALPNTSDWSYAANAYGAVTIKGSTNRVLDLPTTGSNVTYATVYVTATRYAPLPSTTGSLQMYAIQVDVAWPFRWNNNTVLYTNTLVTYLAPDNRDPNSL